MARAFVMKFATDEVARMYIANKTNILDPNAKLDFLHAIVTFCKSYVTSSAQSTY